VANETFLDASGATKYRKSTGAGSAGDPAVAHNIIDGTVTVTGAGGTFPVTDNGGSLTVDGTVAATQSGTWNVTNVSGTISLPTGAATQATLATASDTLTSIDASLADITRAEDAIHTSGNRGVVSLAVRRDTLAGTASDGDYITLSTDADGRLYTTSTVTGSVAVTGTFWQATQPVSIASTLTVTGTGGTFPVTDSGGSLTIDAPVGTPAFVRLSDGTNAIATLPVSLASVPSHDVTNAGTFAVQVSSALPTGANTIGNIGTIATSITPGTAAANLGKAEDAVAGDGDTGVAVWSVRRDTAASGAGATGDYASLNTDSTGHLWTRVGLALPAGTNNIGDVDVLTLPALATGSNTIGNIGTITTSITPGSAAANLGKAEDAVHGSGDVGVAVWSVRRDTAATGTSGDGDYASLNTDSTGHLWTRIGLALPAGTNNIGDVDVLTLPATPAGTNLIGQIVTRPDVSNASDGSTVLVPKFARLSTASTGNQAIVAAVSGKKIRVLSMNVMATASTNAVWVNDGTADLHGNTTYKIPLDVTGATGAGGFVLPFNQLGWFETAANNRPININLGSANGITAIVTYVEV
jgi:hypothetical protein